MHEDLIAWDEDERKQCREEWDLMVTGEMEYWTGLGLILSERSARNEAGLAAVRELRKLRRLTDTARTVRA